MLTINNLHVNAAEHEILKGLNLTVNAGEVHAIMGPNGSGKSTLSNVLAGKPGYEVIQGEVNFLDQNLLALSVQERAAQGIFLAFQYPVEIPGVNNLYFLKTAYNSIRRARGETELDAMDFMKLIKAQVASLGMDERFLQRCVNEGFSGGEKKRNEVLQMLLLQPRLAILDETDSGLDIDALQAVAQGVNCLRSSDRAIVMVTHYQRLLDYVKPDYVHVLAHGKIVKSGNFDLAKTLEKQGYSWLLEESAA